MKDDDGRGRMTSADDDDLRFVIFLLRSLKSGIVFKAEYGIVININAPNSFWHHLFDALMVEKDRRFLHWSACFPSCHLRQRRY